MFETPSMLPATGRADADCLWRCGFCDVECSDTGVEAGLNAVVRLTADGFALGETAHRRSVRVAVLSIWTRSTHANAPSRTVHLSTFRLAKCRWMLRMPFTGDDSMAHACQATGGSCSAASAEAHVDAAAVPALLGTPAAVLRKLSAADRQEQLAALAGRGLMVSVYCDSVQDGCVHIAAVRLLDR
jgi:hypothetical protein